MRYGGRSAQRVLVLHASVRTCHLLTRLPNYTCLQTSSVPGDSRESDQLIDLVRLEVALVDNGVVRLARFKEIQDTEIIDLVKGGAIGNGNFALHAKSVFQTNAPRFTYVGEQIRDDRQKALRWDFVVPQLQSGYLLKSGDQEPWLDTTALSGWIHLQWI